MTSRTDPVAKEIEHFLEAAKALRGELRAKEANCRRMAKLLNGGVEVRTALSLTNAGEARRELSDALEGLEHSRHRVKVVLASRGLDQGMTIGEIGRAWGVSRQLAARYAKEARGHS